MSRIKVTGLYIYPVKGCGGISLSSMKLDDHGPLFDRQFLLVDKNNRFVTQRTHPVLATIGIQLNAKLNHLSLSIGKQQYTLHMNDEFKAPELEVTIWKDQAKAIPASSLLNQWLSHQIGDDVQLVKLVNRPVRDKDGTKFKTRFTDGYPFLIANEKSLEKLNKSLNPKIPMNRFRPNIVIDGNSEFEEDHWHKFSLGKTKFETMKDCERCIVITVDQKTGIKSSEPLSWLKKVHSKHGTPTFGINAISLNRSSLNLGDEFKEETFRL